jgi:hypothetical protein
MTFPGVISARARDDAMTADLDAIEDHGSIRDQRRRSYGAAVQHRSDDRPIPWTPKSHGFAFVGMDDGAVLDVDAVAQIDPVAVPSQHAVEPHARAGAEADAPDHAGVGRDVVVVAYRLDPASHPTCKSCAASRLGADQMPSAQRQYAVIQGADGDPAGAENLRRTIHFVQHVENDCEADQRKGEMPEPIAAPLPDEKSD